nr:MAG TPA: hypothetical protein [Caudoviricetes sp.]
MFISTCMPVIRLIAGRLIGTDTAGYGCKGARVVVHSSVLVVVCRP